MADTDPQRALWKAVRLAGLLSVEDPIRLEQHAQSTSLQRLEALGEGALYNPHEDAYIVLSKGTLTTTSIRPPWLNQANTVIADDYVPLQRVLLKGLHAAIDGVVVADHRARLQRFAGLLGTFYDLADVDHRRRASDEMIDDVTRQSSERVGEILASKEAAREWVTWQIGQLLKAYLTFGLPGCYLHTALAALWTLREAPVPINDILVRAPWLREPSKTDEAQTSGAGARLSPSLSVNDYLKLSGVDRKTTVIWLVDAAGSCHRRADEIRDKALNVGVRPQQFNRELMKVSVYYRAALFIYRLALTFYQEHLPAQFAGSPYEKELVKREMIICEEHRAVIIGSLQHAAYPKQRPDFFQPHEVGEFIAALSKEPGDVMRSWVYDLDLQLRVTHRMRDLILGSARAFGGGSSDLLQEVTTEMYDGLTAEDLASEPDYLSPSLLLLASTFDKEGRAADADECRRRANSLSSRASSILSARPTTR